MGQSVLCIISGPSHTEVEPGPRAPGLGHSQSMSIHAPLLVSVSVPVPVPVLVLVSVSVSVLRVRVSGHVDVACCHVDVVSYHIISCLSPHSLTEKPLETLTDNATRTNVINLTRTAQKYQ